jgi:hypothetical protein
MSSAEPTGPYVFQPYGTVTHPDHAAWGRLYGVGGVGPLMAPAMIRGLTREEAEAVREVLARLGPR